MKTTFGEYIRQLRTDNHLTLAQLAAQLELNSANLSKIENGKRKFDEKRLKKLADVFLLDFEELKVEYFGDLFAKKMYQNNCSPQTLVVAEEKIKYLINKDLSRRN